MPDKITVKQAAVILGLSADAIHYRLQMDMNRKPDEKQFDIGSAHRSMGKKYRKPTYRYDIYLPKVLRYMGVGSVDELSEEKRKLLV